jgi:DHA1 family bicyclomycin/chloramphenicol resistance-like MFS transporter
MRLSTDSAGFMLLLGALLGMIAFGVDTTLPAMPVMQQELPASAAEVQLTLTSFLMGVAAGQVLCGPLSDRFGRRPVLLGSLALFSTASLACAASASLGALTASRFAMGVAAVAGPVLSRAVVRDLLVGDAAARLMARTMVAFGVTPIVAPLIGGFLVEAAGWQAVYLFIAATGTVLFVTVALRLPETAPHPRTPLSPAQLARNFGKLLGERAYVGPLLVTCAAQSGIFAFVTNASFVAANILGFTPGEFAALFSFVMLGHILGAQIGSRLVVRHGIRGMLKAGALAGLAGGVAIAALSWAGVQHVAAIALPMLVYLVGAGLVIPAGSAAAMAPFPKIAGAASSLQLMTQLLVGASLGMVISAAYDGTTRPMATAIGAAGIALFVLERVFSRPQLR